MKSKTFTWIIAVASLAALAMPLGLAAQSNPSNKNLHHHYKLIDMGTFGGPQSYITEVDFTSEADVNNQGVLAGWADTTAPDPYPSYCFWDCFIDHAFRWKNGVKSDLGVLPGGASSQPSWISASGLISGWSENGEIDPLITGFPEVRAVLWKDDQIRDLGVLPEGGYESLGFAVNGSGLVVGLATNSTPDPYSMLGLGYQARAFAWDEQHGMQDLGTLGGPDAQALLVNDRGEVVGWSYTSSAQSALCASFGVGLSLTTGSFIWDKENGMVNLGGIGDTCTLAEGLNNQGQVVGESFQNGDQSGPAFLWDRATGFNVLPTLGGDFADAYSINEQGEAAGGAYLKGNVQLDAALWGKGGITDLGTVDGDTCAFAFSINGSEQVVGFSNCFSESTRGFLWQGGSMTDLNALIVPGSDFQVPTAFTINNRGEIAAKGVNADQHEHAVLLIPCDENHPSIEGCDYSMVDASATTIVRPGLRPASGNMPLPVRSHRNNRLRFPAFGHGN
jgi:probable HAF family extracellular repeat protein